MSANEAVLREALKQIKAPGSLWSQPSSERCFLAHAAATHIGTCIPFRMDIPGFADDYAVESLGLTIEDAVYLFRPGRTISEIEARVNEICAADVPAYGPGDKIRLTRTYVYEGVVTENGKSIKGKGIYKDIDPLDAPRSESPYHLPVRTVEVLEKAAPKYETGALYKGDLTGNTYYKTETGWVTVETASGGPNGVGRITSNAVMSGTFTRI